MPQQVSASRPTTTGLAGPSTAAARKAYVAAADTVCTTANRQLGAVEPANGPSDLVTYLAAQLAVQQRTLSALQHLAEPPADRSRIDAELLQPFTVAISAQRALLPAVQNAVRSGDDVALASIHSQYDILGHPPVVATFVKNFGLTACESFEYFRGQ